jgi:hypothetical protein
MLIRGLGILAYHLLSQSKFRYAVYYYALQAMLIAECIREKIIEVKKYASLLSSLSCDQIWTTFTNPGVPCVYMAVSLEHRAEYVGVTVNWRQRLYKHIRFIVDPKKPGSQLFHSRVQSEKSSYVFVPVSLTGGDLLERRLIRTYSLALNVQHVPTTPVNSGIYRAGSRKRTRHRRKGPRCPTVVAQYFCQGHRYLLLSDALDQLQLTSGRAGYVEIAPGTQFLDNSKMLLRAFGKALVTCWALDLYEEPLSSCWQSIKCEVQVAPLIVRFSQVCQEHPFLAARATLIALLANKQTIRQLYTMAPAQLITLMRSASEFHPVKSRAELTRTIDYVFKARFGLPLAWNPVVRVPWGLHQERKLLSRAARKLLSLMPASKELLCYYQSRLRVVCASGKKISQILHNHRAVAFSVTKDELLSATDYGLCLKACDLPNKSDLLYTMLNVHNGLAPVASFKFCDNAIEAELLKLCKKFYPDVDRALDVPQVAELLQTVLQNVSKAAAVAAVTMSQGAVVPHFGTWRHLRRSLDRLGLVCMPLDRDLYRNVLCSRQNYLVRLRKLFWEDQQHYQVCEDKGPEAIVQEWYELYRANRWSQFGKFYQQGSIGKAYCFPKAKNIQKSRVIVSCAKHPLRQILHGVGRILIFLLCKCAFKHFNLYSVAELVQKIERYKAECPQGDVLLALVSDVKEMYTGMLHAQCKDAVAFLIDKSKEVLRSPFISVAKAKQGPMFVGKSQSSEFICFHLDDLLQFVEFELSNLYFGLGNEIVLLQLIGAAMGGFSSPGCAQAVASYAEYSSMQSFIASGHLFAGRFMDDTLSLLNLSAMYRDRGSLRQLIWRLFHSYDHAGLEVELEKYGSEVTILQSTVNVEHGDIAVSFWNKNASFAESGVQKVCRFLPCHPECMSSQQQKAVIMGLLWRMSAATLMSSLPNLLTPLKQLRFELVASGYSASVIVATLKAFFYAQKNAASFVAWHSLFRKYVAWEHGGAVRD